LFEILLCSSSFSAEQFLVNEEISHCVDLPMKQPAANEQMCKLKKSSAELLSSKGIFKHQQSQSYGFHATGYATHF